MMQSFHPTKESLLIMMTLLIMFGIMINHIAVTKLLSGIDVVWMYDLSLIWIVVIFFASHTMNNKKEVMN